MSELQNKVVALIQLQRGKHALSNMDERRDDFIRHAFAIYYGMGGNAKELLAAAGAKAETNPSMGEAIGDALYELAAVGHIWDIDIIQAAYNRIDSEIIKVSKPQRKTGAKVGS